MNVRAAEALYAAERQGVVQITGLAQDGRGGWCAGGILVAAGHCWALMSLSEQECPLCGLSKKYEMNLVIHLNDDHRLTFSEIARKLGPDSA